MITELQPPHPPVARKDDDCCRKLSRISSKESLELVDGLYADISYEKEGKKGRPTRRSGYDQIMSNNQEKVARKDDDCRRKLSWISSKESLELVDGLYADISYKKKEGKKGRPARRSGYDQIMSNNQEKKLRQKKGIDSAWYCNWCKCCFRDLTMHQFFAHVFKCSFPSLNENKMTKVTRVERSGPVISSKREKQGGEKERKKVGKGEKQGGGKGRKKDGKGEDKDLGKGGKKDGKGEDKDLGKGGKKDGKGEDKDLIQWEAPNGSFAIDCDASVKEDVAGSAFIIRDKFGHFISAGVVAKPRFSVIYHEMDAIKSGLNHGSMIGLNDEVVVRSDSRWAIDSIQGQAKASPALRELLGDIRELQHSFIGHVSFKHIRREANRAADKIATTLTRELVEDMDGLENGRKKYPDHLPFEIIYQYPDRLPTEVQRIISDDETGKRTPRGAK